jgi:hypothetical protein
MIRLAPLGMLLALTLTSPAQAQTRVDLFDRKPNRTGGVILDERTGRVDLYDRESNRVGYGQVDRTTGRLDLYDLEGKRVGSGTMTPRGGILERER